MDYKILQGSNYKILIHSQDEAIVVRYFQILYTSIDKILQGTTRCDKTLQDIAIKMLQATTK